jgi:hypothetical protein
MGLIPVENLKRTVATYKTIKQKTKTKNKKNKNKKKREEWEDVRGEGVVAVLCVVECINH